MKFYRAAREKQGAPLSYLAAKKLIEKISPNDVILIITGARCEPQIPYGETDGHIGAAALARAAWLGLHAKCVISVEESNIPPMDATLRAAGCVVRDSSDLLSVDAACCIDAYPLGPEAGKAHAEYLIEKYHPAAIFFIEKHGPNAVGEFHSVLGTRIDKEGMANTQYLLPIAKEQGILTIGTGDGGNEIGNGVIYDFVHNDENIRYGSDCGCGCGGGIATVAATDVFVAAAISNWGVYSVIAMLAYMKKNVDILHTPDIEKRMIDADAYYGSVEGLL